VKTKPLKGKHTKPGVWDRYRRPILFRSSDMPFGPPSEPLDPGVNFFVLTLEAMGLRTRFSCEGHPDGFYVSFASSYRKALKIKQAGFFSVEIEGDGNWSIRLSTERDEKQHVDCLRWAAEAWAKRFGEPKPIGKRSAGLSPVGKKVS
jgi:hypothetical protein